MLSIPEKIGKDQSWKSSVFSILKFEKKTHVQAWG